MTSIATRIAYGYELKKSPRAGPHDAARPSIEVDSI